MLCGEMSKPTGGGFMMRREGKLAMFTSPGPIAFLCLVIPVTSFSSRIHKYTRNHTRYTQMQKFPGLAPTETISQADTGL